LKKQSKSKGHPSSILPSRRELAAVAALAFAISLISLTCYFQRSEILLNGDAIAHINIARRVFDSRTPGLLQLGTVWLPLPHLLMIPFLVSDAMWQTGIGGSIPSMLAYVLGVFGIFRLTRVVVEAQASAGRVGKIAPWLAALVYAANPNLIYLQTTAMTETVYLAFFVWAIVYLVEFVQWEPTKSTATKDTKEHQGKSLWKCALCVAGAELTRYDGWMLAVAVGVAVMAMAIQRWPDREFHLAALKFVLAIAVVPALWLAYNAAIYGNALEFAIGPYSAKAIARRTATPEMPSYPGTGDVVAAGSYFLKSAELNMASGNWGRVWIAVAIAGLIVSLLRIRRMWTVLLLSIPLLFYALSIAYGGVPLFVPSWWPFTHYNVRYGIELLPLFAISAGLIMAALGANAAAEGGEPTHAVTPSLKRRPETNQFWSSWGDTTSNSGFQVAVVGGFFLILALSYFSVWKSRPICLTEASINSRTKLPLEAAVARTIGGLPPASNYLMYLGDHVGVFEQAGIPLRQVINEGNHRPWKRPSDPEGLWERALADPARYTDFVIAFDGDPVDRSANKSGLTLLSVIHTTGQPEARLYAARSLHRSQ
jgi:hypothetical protein